MASSQTEQPAPATAPEAPPPATAPAPTPAATPAATPVTAEDLLALVKAEHAALDSRRSSPGAATAAPPPPAAQPPAPIPQAEPGPAQLAANEARRLADRLRIPDTPETRRRIDRAAAEIERIMEAMAGSRGSEAETEETIPATGPTKTTGTGSGVDDLADQLRQLKARLDNQERQAARQRLEAAASRLPVVGSTEADRTGARAAIVDAVLSKMRQNGDEVSPEAAIRQYVAANQWLLTKMHEPGLPPEPNPDAEDRLRRIRRQAALLIDRIQ